MKIAFDLRALDGASRFRGIGIYITHLCNNIIPMLEKEGHEVVLYSYSKKNLKDIALRDAVVTIVSRPKLLKLPRALRFLLPFDPERSATSKLPDLSSVGVFFQPYHYFGLPSQVSKTVVVGYDLVPLIFEEDYFKTKAMLASPKSWLLAVFARNKRHLYKKTLATFSDATRVIAISEHTKNDLVSTLDVEAEKCHVIYLGPPDKVAGKAKDTVVSSLNDDYAVFVGGIDSRRDLNSLVEAFTTSYTKNKIQLVLIGRDFENIRDSNLKLLIGQGIKDGSVVSLGYVSELDKKSVIEHCLAVVYPTFYEGFGIPLLEAFEYGAPVITYRNSSLPEVGGQAAMYTENAAGIVNALASLKNDDALRREQIRLGKQQVQKFSWRKNAKQTKRVIEELA